MINPQQLTNREAPIVHNVKEATEKALALAQQQSRRELYAQETLADERIFIPVKHTSSNAAFQYEFTTS